MPALRILGVRTPAAGDDLGLSCFLTLCLRLLQFGTSLYLLIYFAQRHVWNHDDNPDNDNQGPFPHCAIGGADGKTHDIYQYFVPMTIAFAATTVAVCLVAIPTEVRIWIISRRGTPAQADQRATLRPLCNFRFGVLGTVQLVAFAVGVAAVSQARSFCRCLHSDAGKFDSNDPGAASMFFNLAECRLDSSWHTCYQIVIWSQLVEGCIWTFFAIRFVCLVARRRAENVLEREAVGVTREKRWQLCCRLCCSCSSLATCCLFGGWEADTGGFADVSRALANYFDSGGTLDVTVSDIAAGLIVVMREQRKRMEGVKAGLLREAETLHRTRSASDDDRSDDAASRHEAGTKEAAASTAGEESTAVPQSTNDDVTEGVEIPLDVLESRHSQQRDEEAGGSEPSSLAGSEVPAEEAPPAASRTPDAAYRAEDTVEIRADPSKARHRQRMSMIAKAEQQGTAAGAASARRSLVYNLGRDGDANLVAEPAIRTLLSSGSPPDLLAVAEAARYCRWAYAIYSWKLYGLVHHPCTGMCALGCLRCLNVVNCQHRAREDQVIIGDTPLLGLNRTALVHVSQIDPSDIPYSQFRGGFAATPYFIGIDEQWKTVAVVLRGTLSFDDVVTDVTLDPASLEEWGEKCGFDGAGEFGHGGVVACAGWVYEDLESHGILNKLLLGSDPQYPSYRLRIVGHSLGAGTAAVLGLFLRSRYPSLRVVAYEPPGCVFSEGLAKDCEAYVTSVVLNDDVIPRLSLKSLERLRDDVLGSIARMKVPKRKVMKAHIKGNKKKKAAPSAAAASKRESSSDDDNDDLASSLLHRHRSVVPSDFLTQLHEFRTLQQTRKAESGVPDVMMRPPGKIVHFVKTRPSSSPTAGMLRQLNPFSAERPEHPYDARWAEAGDFEEIIVSNSMVADHDPLNVCEAIEGVARAMGLREPYVVKEEEQKGGQ